MNQDINRIISELSKIDEASAKVFRKARAEKAEYAAKITEEKHKYDEELSKSVDKAVDDFISETTKNNNLLLDDLKKQCKEDLASLEKTYEDNHEKWADEIFNEIINEV